MNAEEIRDFANGREVYWQSAIHIVLIAAADRIDELTGEVHDLLGEIDDCAEQIDEVTEVVRKLNWLLRPYDRTLEDDSSSPHEISAVVEPDRGPRPSLEEWARRRGLRRVTIQGRVYWTQGAADGPQA